MLVVAAGFVPSAERHQEILAIIRKFEDLMVNIVDNPDVVFRVVRADQDRVRPTAILKQMIPLRPRFDQLAIGIDDVDAILKQGRLPRGLFAKRAPEAGEIAGQFVWQFQLATVGDEDSVGRLSENPAR